MSKHIMTIEIPFEAGNLVEIAKAATKLEEEVAPLIEKYPGSAISYRQTRVVATARPGVRRGRQRGNAGAE